MQIRKTIATIFLVTLMTSVSSHGGSDEDSWGWNKSSSEKSCTNANGMVITKGPGYATASANEHGVKAHGKGKGGVMAKTGYERHEDSWRKNGAWGKKGGKSWAHSDKSSKKEATKGRTKAYGIGNGEVCTTNGEDGATSNARGNRASGTKAAHQKRKDNWRKTSGWKKDKCTGKSSAWNKQWAQKRDAKSRAKSFSRGRGSSGSYANDQGSGGNANGTKKSGVSAGHEIKDNTYIKENAWGKRRGGKAWAFNKASGSKTKSNADVCAEAHGRGRVKAKTDHNNGVKSAAQGSKGTGMKFGYSKKKDDWIKKNAWKKNGKSKKCYNKPESEEEEEEEPETCGCGRRLGFCDCRRPNYHKIIKNLKHQLAKCNSDKAKKNKKISWLKNQIGQTKKALWKCNKRTKALQKELKGLKKQNQWLKNKLHKRKRGCGCGWKIGAAPDQ